jgi:hypothetical protein
MKEIFFFFKEKNSGTGGVRERGRVVQLRGIHFVDYMESFDGMG